MENNSKITVTIPESARLSLAAAEIPRTPTPEKIKIDKDPVEQLRGITGMHVAKVLSGLRTCLNLLPDNQEILENDEYIKLKSALKQLLENLLNTEYTGNTVVDEEAANSAESTGYNVKISLDEAQTNNIQNLRNLIVLAKQALKMTENSENAKAYIQTVITRTQNQINAIEAKGEEKTDQDDLKIAELQKTISKRTPRLKAREKRHTELLSIIKNFISALDAENNDFAEAAKALKEYLEKSDMFENEEEKRKFLEDINATISLNFQIYLEKEKPVQEAPQNTSPAKEMVSLKEIQKRRNLITGLMILVPFALMASVFLYSVHHNKERRFKNRIERQQKLKKEEYLRNQEYYNHKFALSKEMKKLQNKVSFYHAQILLEGIKTEKDAKQRLINTFHDRMMFFPRIKEKGLCPSEKCDSAGQKVTLVLYGDYYMSETYRPSKKIYGPFKKSLAYAVFTATRKDKKPDPSGDYDYLVHVRYGGSVSGETEFSQRIRFDDYSPVPIDEAVYSPILEL